MKMQKRCDPLLGRALGVLSLLLILATSTEATKADGPPPLCMPAAEWSTLGAAADTNVAGAIAARLRAGCGIGSDTLAWPAAAIRAVEVGWYAEDEPGYLTLSWTAVDGNTTNRSSRSTVYLADRAWHTLLFDVSADPLWKGTVTSVRLTPNPVDWAPARLMALAYVRPLADVNVIPNADRTAKSTEFRGRASVAGALCAPQDGVVAKTGRRAPRLQKSVSARNEAMTSSQTSGKEAWPPFGGWTQMSSDSWTVPVPRLRPRVTYRLDRLPGSPAGECDLHVLDHQGKTLQRINLNARDAAREFTAPDMAVTAELQVEGNAWPRLVAKQPAPILNVPNPWWKAEWIWSRADFASGPTGGVWFRRRFALPAKPVHAELLLTADDCSRVWINGAERPGNTQWPEPVLTDLTALLQPGTNEIVVRVQNGGAWGGLLCELNAKLVNGGSMGLRSDAAWECVEADTQTQPGPDAGWKPAVILGPPGIEPWGAQIAYRPVSISNSVAGIAAASELAKVQVTDVGKRAAIVINGIPYPPFTFYLPGSFVSLPAGKEGMVRNIARQNLHLFELVDLFENVWQGPDQYDFARLDRAMSVLLAGDPEAYVLVGYDVRAPRWWLEQHPDDRMRYSGDEPINPVHDFQSMSSAAWRADVQHGIERFIAHIRRQPYASRIVAFNAHAGQTSEWFCDGGYGHGKMLYSDFSPTAVRAWRDWLRVRYGGDVATFRKAWGRADITFDAAMPLTPEERNVTDLACFLDPVKRTALRDHRAFCSELITQGILDLCGTVKKASDRHWLTGTYYGYLNMVSYGFTGQESGHLGLDRVLASPDVDFLYAPSHYYWRRLGLANGFMHPGEALTANGKLMICELDQRTFSESLEVQWPNGRVDTVEETTAMMDRDYGLMATRGQGLHWMEMSGRWFQEPVIQSIIGREMAAWRNLPPSSGLTPFDVCVVSDLLSPTYVKLNMGDGIHAWLVGELVRCLPETGFAWEQVLLSDLLATNRVGRHKLYIMTNVLVLSPEERAAIETRLAREQASVLWLYAPGAFTPNGPATATNVAATVGLPVRMIAGPQPMGMEIEPARGGGRVDVPAATGPWFVPEKLPPGVEVWARDTEGHPLMARRFLADRSVWFSSVPTLSPTLMRVVARAAGAHIYAEDNDPLHIGNDLIFLHAKTSGPKRIQLPQGMRLKPILGPKTQTLRSGETWEAQAPSTYGFAVERD